MGHGVCAPPGQVAQPRLLAADRGYPAGAANRGRLFFGYFILAKQKKVTSCRSTTGEVDLVLSLMLGSATLTPTYMLRFKTSGDVYTRKGYAVVVRG